MTLAAKARAWVSHVLAFSVMGLALALSLTACSDPAARVVLRGGTMGTTWSVIYDAASGVDGPGLQARLEEELVAINQALSTYIPEAEISQLNAAESDISQVLSSRFSDVLTEALAVAALTGGAYDVTVGPLVELWGFGSREFVGDVPSDQDISDALSLVGDNRLSWDAETRALTKPAGMRIDMSSIAKGYAVDRLTNIVRSSGIQNALVEIGGELRALGQRPEGGPWRLAVESPVPSQSRIIDAINVSDAAVATSGDYRNYFEVDGVRYSHLVDPRTGYPVAHDLVSVTVVDDNCMRADALATALIVLGLEEARALADAEGLAAQFVSRRGDELEVHYTESFAAFRVNRNDTP